jgi:hypothetical protein
VQLVAYQGTPGNLGTKFFEYSYGTNTTQTMNITNTTDCVYLILDGYAGDVCDVDMSLSCTDCGCTLPVDLVSFEGEAKEGGNLLKWRTLSEEENSHFIVERSRSGRDFQRIGRVEGKGSSSRESRYTLMDEDPYGGVSYYRLKQVDMDGELHTYETIAVDRANSASKGVILKGVYPNPLRGERLSFRASSDMLREVKVRVYDRSGRKVRDTRRVLEKGENTLSLDLQGLSQGFYSLTLQKKGERKKAAVEHFVIEGGDR